MKPLWILPISLSLYSLLWLLAPVEVVYSPSLKALVLFFVMFLSIQAGGLFFYLAIGKIPLGSLHTQKFDLSNLKDKNLLLIIILILVVVGVVFRVYDKFYIREIGEFESAVNRRDSETSASIFGIFSAFLFPLCLVLPAFFHIYKISFKSKIILLAIFILPALEVVYMGSRGLAIVTLFMAYVYLYGLFSIKKRIVLVFLMAVCFLGFFYFSGIIFLERITAYGMTPLYSAFNSAYAFTMIPSKWAESVVNVGASDSPLVFMVINAAQYYLHGFLEFSYLIDNFSGYDFQYGAYTFHIANKFCSFFGVCEELNHFTAAPRYGTYTTLLGPFWVDFGYGSFFFLFLIGYFLAFSYYKIERKNYLYLPLYGYLSCVVFFSPVVSFIQNALGLYVLFSCLFLILLGKCFLQKRIFWSWRKY